MRYGKVYLILYILSAGFTEDSVVLEAPPATTFVVVVLAIPKILQFKF